MEAVRWRRPWARPAPAATVGAPGRVAVGDVLLGVVRHEPAAAGWLLPGLLEAAEHHRLLILLAAAVRDAGLTGPDARRIRAGGLARAVIAQRLERAGVEVSALLGGAGIDHAVLKGPVVAAAYPEGSRDYADLDVLVAPARMGDALALLADHGIHPAEGQPGWPRSDGFGELELVMPGLGALDLHADLIHFAHVRSAYRLRTEELLARSRLVQLPGGPVAALDGADTLLHVALHASISGADRLGWFADMAALARQGDFSWDELVARARVSRTALPVGVVLERARDLAGAPVPDEVVRELLSPGRRWAAVLSWFDRRRPVAHNHGRFLHGRVLVKATRPTGSASLRALAEAAWRDVVVEVVRNPSHPWRTGQGPTGPGPTGQGPTG